MTGSYELALRLPAFIISPIRLFAFPLIEYTDISTFCVEHLQLLFSSSTNQSHCMLALGLQRLVDIINNIDYKKNCRQIFLLLSSRLISYDLLQEPTKLRFDQRGTIARDCNSALLDAV